MRRFIVSGLDPSPLWQAHKIQYLRLVHNFCDRDTASFDCSDASGEGREGREKEPRLLLRGQAAERKDGGLMLKIVRVLMKEPSHSVYRFWLATCVEAFLRGSDPWDQVKGCLTACTCVCT